MVLDTAKPKNRKSTIQPGTRGRDAKELTLKEDILQAFTIDFSEIQFIVNHSSQLDGQNKSAKRWTNLQNKIIRIISPQRNLEDTKDKGIFTLNKSVKNEPMRLRSDFRAAVSNKETSPPRVRRTSCRTHFSRTMQVMASFCKHIVAGQV